GLLAVDVFLKLSARRLAQHAPAGIELLLRGLQRLVLLVQLGDLLIVECLHARAERLTLCRLGSDALDIDERVFRTSREWRGGGGSWRGRCRRWRRSRRLSEAWSGSQHDAERRGNDESSHYSQSFPVQRKLKILARGKYRADVKGGPATAVRLAVPWELPNSGRSTTRRSPTPAQTPRRTHERTGFLPPSLGQSA